MIATAMKKETVCPLIGTSNVCKQLKNFSESETDISMNPGSNKPYPRNTVCHNFKGIYCRRDRE